MGKDKARACRFCGCEDVAVMKRTATYEAVCDRCGAAMPGTSEAEAVAKWNERPESGCDGCIWDGIDHYECGTCSRWHVDRYERELSGEEEGR